MGPRFPLLACLLMISIPGLAQDASPSPFRETPESWRAKAQAAQAKDKDQSHILTHDLSIELDEAGRFHRTTHRVVEVRDERDVQRWSNLDIAWKKTFESRPEINVRVIRPDGEVRVLDPKTIAEAPAGEIENGIYSDAILLKILPPGLVPGSILEMQVKEHETRAIFQSGRYDQSPLRSFLPIDRLSVNLSWHPSQTLRYRWPDGLKLKKTENKNSAGWPSVELKGEAVEGEALTEALSPDSESNTGFLEISSTSSWSKASAEYQKIAEEAAKGNKKIPALLKKLKPNASSQAAIIDAVTFYVQKEIRYTSLAFGEASVIPRSPDETLERGYGDCKDKATLAQALLKEAGINSRLALLHAAPFPAQSDDMPGLDRFNHVILAVEQGKNWIWIDLTAEYFRPGLVPPAVAGQKALLIGPEGKELRTIPAIRMEDNHISIVKDYSLPRLGPARLLRTESATGIFDTFYRRSLAGSNVNELLKDFEGSVDANAKLDAAKSSDLKDFTRSLTLEGQFSKVSTVDVWPAGTQVFAFPHQLFSGLPSPLDPLNERDVRGKIMALKKQLENRQSPVKINFPFQRDFTYRFHLPAYLEINSRPDSTSINLGAAAFSLKTRDCGASCVELHYSFQTGPSTSWTPEQAQDFANGLVRVLDDKLYAVSVKPKAFALGEQGKLHEAVQYAQRAVQSPEGQPADKLTLAQLLSRIGLIEESQQMAREAVKAQSQEKRILLHAAELLIRGENQKDCSKGSACPEARQLYEQALKLDSTDRFALRTLPLLLVYNSSGLRYGKGADIEKADAAFAKAMKSSLAEDQEFFNTYLQHLTFTGQWIALDQALRRPPDSVPAPVIAAWRIITLIGNQHPEDAKQELDALLARSEGQASMQGLIKELMQDRRYKEASQLFQFLKDRLPQTKGAAEALAVMEPCPDATAPQARLQDSLRQYICTMLSPDSTLKDGLQFVPSFAQANADYRKYFEEVEWDRRTDNRNADTSLPPYFLIDSASTAYDVEQVKKLQEGTLLALHNTKVFAASPFAAGSPEEGFEPKVFAVQENGVYRFIAVDTPSVLSLLWFRAHEAGQDKAAQEYATLLGELLDRSMKAQDEKKLGTEGKHYRSIVKNFRPLLNGSAAEQELAAAIYAPTLISDKVVKIFDRELAKKTLKQEQLEILDILAAGRLITMKRSPEALQRLIARSAQGSFTFPMVQTMLEAARTGEVKADAFTPLLDKLEKSDFEERLSLVAEIKNLLGDQQGAEKVYQQWLKNPAPNGLTENNMAWFYFTTGRTDQKALKLAQTASEMGHQSVANLNTLASIQAELGMTSESIATQTQYRNLLGDRDLGAADDLVTAINAEKLGLPEAALKRLKKIQTDPETSDLKQLLHAKIQQLEKAPKVR